MNYGDGAAEWAEIMDPRDAVEPRSVLDREDADQSPFDRVRERAALERKEAEERAAVAAAEREAEGPLVGKVFATSWGYDQTNVEFFEVVRETASSAWLRRLKADVRDGRVFPAEGDDRFTTDYALTGNAQEWTGDGWGPNPTYVRDHERGYSEKVCRKRRGYKGQYAFKITESRTAFPYEGGGKYDTIAAGHPGH